MDINSRRNFLRKMALGTGALVAGSLTPARADDGTYPNIILYVVDDQGTNDAGCYGRKNIKTPGLDTLAKEGTRFTHGFCTTASCSASRSVILSGKHNHANGQYGHQHAYHHFSSFDNVKSLPVLLEGAGYRTASAGKYHVAPETIYHFQNYVKGNSPVTMANNCKELIASEKESPFFLYFCTHEPHRPFMRDGSDPVSPNDVTVPPYLPDIPECRKELAQYYMSVQRADSGLKRLIEMVKESGKWNHTMIIYISDNGIAFPGAKTTLYEPGMRLPCVVRSPYQKEKGVVNNAMLNWADIAPTILDFAAVNTGNYKMHGRSFLPVLEQEKPEGWDEVYASHTFHEITMYYPMRVVRERRYKLLWNIAHGLEYPFASDLFASKTWQGLLKREMDVYGKRKVEAFLHRPKFELYDLEKDPYEVENLAESPAHAKILKRLQDKLKDFQKKTKDPWLLKWRYE